MQEETRKKNNSRRQNTFSNHVFRAKQPGKQPNNRVNLDQVCSSNIEHQQSRLSQKQYENGKKSTKFCVKICDTQSIVNQYVKNKELAK